MNDERTHFLDEEEIGGGQGFDGDGDGKGDLGFSLETSNPASESSNMGGGPVKDFKRIAPPLVGTGGESDDDQRPIVSLFKHKKPRIARKAKAPEPEARSENPRTDDVDPGEMNSTLARLKKKLKGSKRVKDSGGAISNPSPLDGLQDLNRSKVVSMQSELEVKPKTNRSQRTLVESNEQKALSVPIETSDHSPDIHMKLSSIVQMTPSGSADRAHSTSRKRKPKKIPVTLDELNRSLDQVSNGSGSPLVKGSGALDAGCSLASDGTPEGLVVSRRGKKYCRGHIRKTDVDRGVNDEHLSHLSPDTTSVIVAKRHRKPRGGHVPVMDVHPGVAKQFGRISRDEISGVVARKRGRKLRGTVKKSSSISVSEDKLKTLRLDDDGIARFSEGISGKSAPSLHPTLGSVSVMGPEERLSTTVDELDILMGNNNNVNHTQIGATKDLLPHQAEETHLLEKNGLKQCSSGNMSSVMDIVGEIQTVDGFPKVKTSFLTVKEKTMGSLGENHMNYHDQGKPYESIILGMSRPYLPSNEALPAQVENLSTGKISQKGEGFDHLFDISVENLKEPWPSLAHNSETLRAVQEDGSFHRDNLINDQDIGHLQCFPLSNYSRKEEDIQKLTDGFSQPPTEDLVSDKSPLILMPVEKEDSIQSDNEFSRPSREHLSVSTSHVGKDGVVRDCGRKEEDTQIYSEDVSVPSSQVAKQLVFVSTDDYKVFCGIGYSPNESVERQQGTVQSLDDTPKELDLVDAVVTSDHDNTYTPSTVPRATRIMKKLRHGDMAYEGDVDWEVLMHEQRLLTNVSSVDDDQRAGTIDKPEPLSGVQGDGSSWSTAAVAAGLKACAAGPIEKIKFKELLKRKSGLLEYLNCRNIILGLWNKDVNHILSLTHCGLSEFPSENDSPRTSLIREIYMFLDQNGYINAGIASEKEPIFFSTLHSGFSKETKTETCGTESESVYATKNESASVFENIRISENVNATKRNNISFELQNKTSVLETEVSETEDLLTFTPVPKIFDLKTNPVVPLKQRDVPYDANQYTRSGKKKVECIAKEGTESNARQTSTEYDSNVQKRIIIVGAGPAGLTAARHLQRQGFSAVVLEARDRIGGRVYTDRSSLSVPVDLGASIITGVEADVATERRPDPSSLICSQLGLELTVLNSDCPLYDVVTGNKVHADLDEALEAEFNSLLDDMVLLVAQNGESAMRMSLEDGLEYALRRRRMARPASTLVDSDQFRMSSDYGTVNPLCSAITDSITINGSDCDLGTKIMSPLERRVMDWHFANLEYGCAALLKEVSLPYWNQDDAYGGFGGAHCMIKGGYSTVIESIGKGVSIHMNHTVTEIMYSLDFDGTGQQQSKVKVMTSNGEFAGDAVLITVPLGCLKANAIKFSPNLPEWKLSSIRRLGFGVLDKVVLEFTEVFWDDTVDYFGATAEETDHRGECFMFWNVKKTAGAPILIALVVGKAAIDGQSASPSDHVNNAMTVLRKLFADTLVPDPVASVVTSWGTDPFSMGAYSYVALGASGEDYDILGKPVANCLFFAGEATCKEHPDTVGGAMLSGLREAVRIIDILSTGKDYVVEVEAMEAIQRHSDSGRSEVRDMSKRLEACKLSHVLCKNSGNGLDTLITKEAILQDMFTSAKTTSGRLHLAKELLRLPVEDLKSFAGTKKGLSTLNSWILDSLGKNATQLLRHCVRLLVLISTDLLAVRLSGIGRTMKEKVCVHTSRDIRAIASQLVKMWIEVFRKEKAANGRLKLLKQTTASESLKNRPKYLSSGKPPLSITNEAPDARGNVKISSSAGNNRKTDKLIRLEPLMDTKSEDNSSRSQSVIHSLEPKTEDTMMSEGAATAFAAAEVARTAAVAAAEVITPSEAETSTLRELPKIPSFYKFARRDLYTQIDDNDIRRKWPVGVVGRQECLLEIDSRNCRIQNWSLDFSVTYGNLESSRMSSGNYTHPSHSNEIVCPKEQSGESRCVDSRLTKAWVDIDNVGIGGVKDSLAIDRWQSQAMEANASFFNEWYMRDEEESNRMLEWAPENHLKPTEESSASQVAENKSSMESQPRGVEHIKQGVEDYVASLLMPLYKTKKIDKEGYKSIMKKTVPKVIELCTEAEKLMTLFEFLDFRRKNKIRSFVDGLIERIMAMNSNKS